MLFIYSVDQMRYLQNVLASLHIVIIIITESRHIPGFICKLALATLYTFHCKNVFWVFMLEKKFRTYGRKNCIILYAHEQDFDQAK